ncbi:MAG TPA: MBL fold metallo-hydrolase, partial [Saprospiraceae bacterium]|nr:MBL fold metallo-hydrolase [Saprospiraceae bacterium]
MAIQVASLTFNPFEENTYILMAPSKECIIIDPGCADQRERDEIKHFISDHQLRPVRLINTHCHIDHILGNAFVSKEFGLEPEIHKGELPVLKSGMSVAGMYGIPYQPSPLPSS